MDKEETVMDKQLECILAVINLSAVSEVEVRLKGNDCKLLNDYIITLKEGK